jgi:formylglycine-generating enzyme required for sulfatase activity
MAALRRSLLLIPLIVVVQLDSNAVGQPPDLANLLMDADEKQFLSTFPKFREQAEAGLPFLIAEIERTLPPDAEDDAKEKLAKRQANAAVALLRLDRSSVKAWPLLNHSPDPRTRSYLIHRLIPCGAEASAVVKRLKEEPDLSIRRALLLSLGEFGEKELSPEDFKAFLPKLREVYRTEADPGLHAAAEWLLKTWKEQEWLKEVDVAWASNKEQRERRLGDIQRLLTKEKDTTSPQWYVNGQGQTMVVIPGPVEFRMGAPATAPDGRKSGPQHNRLIGRTFAVAAKYVTVEQYRQFDEDYVLPAEIGPMRRAAYSGSLDMPVVGTTWYQAAAYCNWLSKTEGIADDQWCYEIEGEGTQLKLNYLNLTGYRLPTEAEMEYSTRAGALTSRYYGETETLLAKYAWYHENSLIGRKTGGGPKAVGTLKPNDFGFFDMHGYLFAWCQESFRSYPTVNDGEVVEDREDTLVREGELVVSPEIRRVARGTPFGSPATLVRSAARNSGVPAKALQYHGFRMARTMAH